MLAQDDPALTPPGQVASGQRVLYGTKEAKGKMLEEWGKGERTGDLFREDVTGQVFSTSDY